MTNRGWKASWMVALGCAGLVPGAAFADKPTPAPTETPANGPGLMMDVVTEKSGKAPPTAVDVVVTTPGPAPLPIPYPVLSPMKGIVGATETRGYTLPSGFFDDAIRFDDRGFGFAVTDGAAAARVTIAQGADLASPVTFDVSALTAHVVEFQLDGKDLVVIGTNDTGEPIGGRVDASGKVKWRVGPATALTFVTRDKKPMLAVYRHASTTAGSKHTVEVLAFTSGKRVGAARTLALDPLNTSTALDFKLGYFTDGFTRAIGIKGGRLNPKIDQRDPDTESTYDLVSGKFIADQPILDLYAQRKRFDAVTKARGQTQFIAWNQDQTGLELWRGATRVEVILDQSILPYDQTSLQTAFDSTGGAWLALQVDPLNATAIKKKTHDTPFFDIYAVGADGKATRRIRIPADNKRFRFGAAPGGQLWLLERNRGFDRGGARLSVLAPQ